MYDYCRNINKTRTRLKQCIQNVFQWIFFSCVMLQPETIIIQIHLTFQMDLYIISYYLIGECCSSQSEKLFPFCKLPPVLHRGEASLPKAQICRGLHWWIPRGTYPISTQDLWSSARDHHSWSSFSLGPFSTICQVWLGDQSCQTLSFW